MEEETKSTESDVEMTEPIVINMGKQSRKRIKRLLKGSGKLWDEVEDVIENVSDLLGEELDGKTLLPLILVYNKKPKKKRLSGLFGL